MMKKGLLLFFIFCIICVCIVFGTPKNYLQETNEPHSEHYYQSNDLIQNVLSISTSDIEKIEVLVAPKRNGLNYRKLHESEFEEIVGLLHESHGTYVLEPESVDGSYMEYIITLVDGTKYQFGNNTKYYFINNNAFEVNDEWLLEWPEVEVDSVFSE